MGDLGLKIRHELTRYLADQISLQELRDWFLPAAWNADVMVDGRTAEFVHAVELLLSEFEAGHWLETEVRDRLIGHLAGYLITFGTPGPDLIATSSSRTEWAPIPVEATAPHPGFADIRFAKAFS